MHDMYYFDPTLQEARESWEDGPWQVEPDKMYWVDIPTDLDCLILRHQDLGHLCGYVGIPRTHPYWQMSYDEAELADIHVHGGLTYAAACSADSHSEMEVCHVALPGREKALWWLGFDAAHGRDTIPGMMRLNIIYGLGFPPTWATYKDLTYMQKECESLARQLFNQTGPLTW